MITEPMADSTPKRSSSATTDFVSKLWRLCSVLRKDGITYHQYVTELTYLLFLKMLRELQKEEEGRGRNRRINIPIGYRWADIVQAKGTSRLRLYQEALTVLGNPRSRVNSSGRLVNGSKLAKLPSAPLPRIVQAIFANAATFVRDETSLAELVEQIDKLHWYSAERDRFGELYEGLLQKNAEEMKRGAGQYFTPRVLIDAIVRMMKPQLGEIIQDPAGGTGGFLVSASRHICAQHRGRRSASNSKVRAAKHSPTYHAMENVADTYRLLLMNLCLHGISPDHTELGDTLSPRGEGLAAADLIMTNPPFGPAGGRPTRKDLTVTKSVSSYQLPFVEHCIRGLRVGGRAAIVVPDNVLFESGRGLELRRMIMRTCKLHTILRLPTGIFYAQGVKTNVIFLQKRMVEERCPKKDATSEVWIYDLRSMMPQFGKTNPFDATYLEDVVQAYGSDPNGASNRKDHGASGRFRRFSRDEIASRGDTLDITWLHNGGQTRGLTELEEIAATMCSHLEKAVAEIRALQSELTLKGLVSE
jgi:type I restriction enzyme M protein